MVSTLAFACFGRPRLGHTIKTNLITIRTVDPDICSILMFLKNGLGLASPTHFVYDLGQKCKYFKSEKSFQVEIESIFHHSESPFIEANKNNFWEGENLTLN